MQDILDSLFLVEMAENLEALTRENPNLNLHWSEIQRLKSIAALIKDQSNHINALQRALVHALNGIMK